MNHTKAIVVLGCGNDAAGNLNPDAEASVRLAYDLWRNDTSQIVIMTGNVSYKADFTPSISEAQAMKEYALTIGLPEMSVFVEAESKDSIGNLYFTKTNLLMPLGITDIVIIRGPNQTAERINYLCQKIFGPTYRYELIERDKKRPAELEREQRSLDIAKQWLDEVADGDHAAVYRLMRERHPGYNSAIPLSSLKQLF